MKNAYLKTLSDQLQVFKEENRYRIFVDLERRVGDAPYALWHSSKHKTPPRVVVWCSNDYLGMSHHPEVLQEMLTSAQTLGVGSGGTRNISGTAHTHVLLEQEVANLHNKDRGLIFTSGYTANEATISALASAFPGCVVLSDEKNHASIIQGIRHSCAEKKIFKHNDVDDLRRCLQSLDPACPKLIIFVSVYSMDGDFPPIQEICELAEEFQALTYLDEVHAVGIYGPEGAGFAAERGLQDRIDIIQANFAKAYGVVGGYIAGPESLVDYVRSAASGFIFTTSLPPATAAAALKSIQILRKDDTPRRQLWDRVTQLKSLLKKTNLPYCPAESHIVPVVVGHALRCREVCLRLLEDHSIYVQPINFPTVPRGQERLRITVTPAHTPEMVNQLIDALQQVWQDLNIKNAA